MKSAPLFCLAFVFGWFALGCSRSPATTYRVPPEKQADAARLMIQLTESMSSNSWSGFSPDRIADTATKQVLAIYGEPVKP